MPQKQPNATVNGVTHAESQAFPKWTRCGKQLHMFPSAGRHPIAVMTHDEVDCMACIATGPP